MWKADLCCPPLVNLQGKIWYIPGRGWVAQALRIRGERRGGGSVGREKVAGCFWNIPAWRGKLGH